MIHPSTHPLTHPLTHSLTHSFIHSFIHSLPVLCDTWCCIFPRVLYSVRWSDSRHIVYERPATQRGRERHVLQRHRPGRHLERNGLRKHNTPQTYFRQRGILHVRYLDTVNSPLSNGFHDAHRGVATGGISVYIPSKSVYLKNYMTVLLLWPRTDSIWYMFTCGTLTCVLKLC